MRSCADERRPAFWRSLRSSDRVVALARGSEREGATPSRLGQFLKLLVDAGKVEVDFRDVALRLEVVGIGVGKLLHDLAGLEKMIASGSRIAEQRLFLAQVGESGG